MNDDDRLRLALEKIQRLEELLETYRRIWERLPEGIRTIMLSAMECWSPIDYERLVTDCVMRREISSAPAEAKSSNPGAGASEEQAQGKE